MFNTPKQSITPDNKGYFGDYGGKYIPEILYSTFEELIKAFNDAKKDPIFWKKYVEVMQSYSCRPTPVTPLKNFAEAVG